jgi:surface polysaccharide O-acyltransferase-like enzyme
VSTLRPDAGALAVAPPRIHASRLRAAVAVLMLATAWVHVAYHESHWDQWWAYGAFFLVVGVAQALFALLILARPRPWVAAAGIAGTLAVIGMYVVSRTVGVPVGPHADFAERAGTVDLATTAAEIAALAMLLVLVGERTRRAALNAVLVAGLLLWGLRLSGQLV